MIEVRKPTAEEIIEMRSWPIWECEPSQFPWQYSGTETCYLLEGRVRVTADDGEVEFGIGDRVVFPDGLMCTWTVVEKVRKHYNIE